VISDEAQDDEAQQDFDREHRLAQAALQRKRIDIPAGKVMRYESVYDQSEDLMCDMVWIDRLTDKEVMRYDAADPANTNSYYGARPDEEAFVRRGLDYYELIDADKAMPLPQFPIYDDGRWDEDDDCRDDF
jgi:hypothetical protein